MEIWRTKHKKALIINPEKGSQFCDNEYARWCKDSGLNPSMSGRSNCWDNAVA
jgi:hypothetical protein